MGRLVLSFSFALLFLGESKINGQPPPGSYSPIKPEEIARLKLNHYFTEADKFQKAEFGWTFDKSTFLIQRKGSEVIPATVMKLFLSEGNNADEIRGEWTWQTKVGELPSLIFKNIQVNGKMIEKEVTLFPIKTAPTVLRMGQPQLVFEIRSKK